MIFSFSVTVGLNLEYLKVIMNTYSKTPTHIEIYLFNSRNDHMNKI